MKEDNYIYARVVSGDITTEEKARLQASGEWAEIQSILDATDGVSVAPYDNVEELIKLNNRLTPKKPIIRPLLIRWLSVAAAVAIIIGAIVFMQSDYTTVSANMGEHYAYTLPEGSQIVLNAGSEARFDQDTWIKHREIRLSGEAFFDVQKNPNPFSVITSQGKVTVLGTQFNVRGWNEDLRVACYSGKVLVQSGTQELILVAGESVAVVRGRMLAKRSHAESSPSWPSGRSTFDDQDASDVFQELNRQYGIQVRFNATDKNFSGSFSHDDLHLALQQICEPLLYTYKLNAEQNLIIVEDNGSN